MTKHSLYIVTINGVDHAVRATGKRAAEAAGIEARVSTRKATDDDIIRIVRSQQPIIGDAVDPVDEAVHAFTSIGREPETNASITAARQAAHDATQEA